MPDREKKVIKALECCERTDGEQCKNCPYTDSDICVEEMSKDTLALLKEQEAVVRCKDCKHFDGEGCSNGNSICYQYATRPDWYCADGERKKGL